MNYRKDHVRHLTALAILIAVFLIGIYVWDGNHSGDSMLYSAQDASALSPASGADEVAIGAKWDLIDYNGKTVNQDSYTGKYKLVFFGFASCPDICPTTLQKIGKTMEMLGDRSGYVQPLFITTDPATDKPEVMAKYVKQFGGNITGLTGTQAQIDEAVQSFRVYAEKVEDDQGGYFMNHSAVIYFMTPDNKLVSVFDSTDSPADMAKEIRRTVTQS